MEVNKMKLQEFVNVFNGDIYIAAPRGAGKKKTNALPIGNLLKGSTFVMNLTVLEIVPYLDSLGVIVHVDIPPEIVPGLIKHNNGDFIALEWDEWED
jgi:hypothetical protein